MEEAGYLYFIGFYLVVKVAGLMRRATVAPCQMVVVFAFDVALLNMHFANVADDVW